MGRHQYIAGLLFACLLVGTSTLDGREPIRMRVSPMVAMAPGFLTVRVNIEAAAENRTLQVVAESPDFYRSSQIQLNGAQAAPIAVFEFRNLPSGFYQVTGVLSGVNGPRATASGVAKVQPSPGQ
jgi:hypothetical protein